MIIRPTIISLLFLALGLSPVVAKKRETIKGPIFAKVVNVYDGDTIEVLANIWPGHQINVRVRIRGIDAPEIRSKCSSEHYAALSARNRLREFISGKPVQLSKIKGGKYFGRVLADVTTFSGQDIEKALLATGLVRPYRGKRRTGWC